MRLKPWLGLLAAGPMSSSLFRLPNLNAHLGPVASASLRVASRLANRLKAGAAVPPEGLAEAELILITGPESGFPELLDLALHAGIDWHGRSVVLLDFRRDATDLGPLRALGASTGTLDYLDAFTESRFVADADDAARRRIQRFAAATASSVFYLESGRKQVFSAGSAFTGTLFTPLVAATVDCLKKAGLTSAESLLIAERNTLQTLRSWLKSGRKGWTGTIADHDMDAIRRQLQALSSESEVLSAYFANTAKLALLMFGEDATWLSSLAEDSSSIMVTMDDLQARRFEMAGRLAANLSHDWNNLLTLLAAQAGEIAALLPPDHPAQNAMQEMNNSLGLASDAPRRLLSWLREEPGTLLPRDLQAAVLASLPLVRVTVGSGVQCVVNLAESLPQIRFDRSQLTHALLNLASNATNAMSGKGTLTITTAAAEGGISLSVADTGAGMDEETRRRVFEPFFSTRHDAGGTGLGLQTVQAFAQAHGATLEVQSAPGQGCVVILTFPAFAITKAAAATAR